MASHTPEAHLMFETDVSALSELLDRMGECHRELGTLARFSTSLNSMGDLVDHPRWKRRVIYEKVLSALGSSWNEDAGRPILATLEPIENVEDSEILELYLHIEGDRLGFSKRMALLDKIVAEGRSPSVRLQYRGVRALQLMLIGDQEGCIAELRSAISEYKERSTNRTDDYGTLQLARSCQLLAGLTNDKELFGEAEGLLRKLLATDQYTPSGRAMLWRDLGDVLLDQGQAPEATDAYLRSLDYLDTSLGRLKVAKGMAVMGRMTERAST